MLVDVICTKRRKCITGINTRSHECLERKKNLVAGKQPIKGLLPGNYGLGAITLIIWEGK